MNTQAVVDELCDLYRALIQNLNPNSSSNDEGGHHKPSSRPPLRLDISHDRLLLDQTAEKIAAAARAQLGFQHRHPRTVRRTSTAWHISRHVCQLETIEVVDYATVASLRALPALLDALPLTDAKKHERELDRIRRRARVTLGIDKPPMELAAFCPECHGWTVPLLEPQQTLLADPNEARVWCRNRQCGYRCENPACWCAVPGQTGHQLVWTHTDLIRLSRLLETA